MTEELAPHFLYVHVHTQTDMLAFTLENTMGNLLFLNHLLKVQRLQTE